jgi:hypothetical protein
MSRDLVHRPHFALLLAAAWGLVLVELLAQYWGMTGTTLPDADDAMRLVEVRDFLAGQGWFDLHQARVNPPAGFDSHWSRLIDAGLAGLYLLFRLMADTPLAERLMLALWPVLWLLPVMGAAAAIAWRLAGREAACVVLLFAVFGLPGMGQFRPGRIDHHNVQIALAVLVVAASAWSDRHRGAAWAAGALTGLAFTIGLESLALLALCGAAFALRYLIDPAAAPALRAYGLALAGSMLAGFLVSVAPDRWGESFCEQIALNSTVAVTISGLGLVLASAPRITQSALMRGLAIAVTTAVALGAGLALEPRCIGGPFAIMDPTVRTVWLMDISEMQSLGRMLGLEPLSAVATMAFPVLGLLAVVLLTRDRRRDFGFLAAAGIFALACALTVAVTKFYPYALWLAVPLVAVAALDICARFALTSLVPRFLAAMLVTPMAVTVGAISIASAAGTTQGLEINPPARQACVDRDNIAALARLPVGLMVANALEFGPYIVAFSPHSVLAAPYHIRLSAAILTANAAYASPPEAARRVLDEAHVDYVVICGPTGLAGLTDAALAASLWTRIQRGDLPDWLKPEPGFDGHPLAVYRVDR